MRIDGISQGQLNISNISDILSKLNVGDVVRAQVIDIMANELILKLFDGTTMNASSMSQLNVKTGDFVDFMVKSKNDNKLFLETVKNTQVTDAGNLENEIKKQLISLDIKPDEQSVNIARELKGQNIPITKDIIEKAVEGVLKFKNLTPDKAVFLASNNLEVNEQQISKLNSLIESKAKVSTDIKELISQLGSIDDADILAGFQKGILNKSDVKNNTSTQNNSIFLENKEFDNKFIEKSNAEKALAETLNKAQSALFKNSSTIKQSEDSAKILKSIELIIKADSDQQKATAAEKLISKLNNAMDAEGISMEKLPPELQKELKSLISEAALKLKELHSINTSIDEIQKRLAEKTKESIVRELENTFIKIDENTTGKDIDAKKLYNDLLSKLEAIREGLQQAGNTNASKEFLAKVDSLESNIRFLNDINSYSSYVQIPLNINNSSTTGELYILKRDPRRKKIDPENATMYISLNTENMGQVDSLITISKKNVSVNMRVEEQAIIDFLKESHKELYNRLQDKGYKLVDFKYRLLESPPNVLNINSVVQKNNENNRFSIDYRI